MYKSSMLTGILLLVLVGSVSITYCEILLPWQCTGMDEIGSGSAGHGELMSDSLCIPYHEALGGFVLSECAPFFPEEKCHFFNYGARSSVSGSIVDGLFNTIRMHSSSDYCKEIVLAYLCNLAYPGCNASTEIPLGICTAECFDLIRGECSETFSALRSAAELVLMSNLSTQCVNSLGLLSRFGFNFTTHPTKCYNISEVVENTSAPPTNDPMSNERLENWVIPVTVSGPLALAVLLCILLVCLCWRRRTRKKKRNQHQTTNPLTLKVPAFYIKEDNEYSNYQLHSLTNDAAMSPTSFQNTSEAVQEHDEDVPLFQFLSEDVARLGNNAHLREALVPFKQLCFAEEIAQGAFGRVYRGLFARTVDMQGRVNQEDLVEVAIKTIKDIQVEDSYNNIRDFIEESALMHSFDHPHVLGLLGISLDDNGSPYLILPFMQNGDLRTFLKNKREMATKSTDTGYPEGLQYDMLVRVCHEIAEGMEYLASRKLVHRDLAARNCMVDANVSIKVADFGLTRDIYESDYHIKRQNAKIPVKWMSPESLHDRISNEGTDVWAYGVTCWEVFSLGRIPYPTIPNQDVLDYLEQGKRLKQPALCSDEMYELMRRCWLSHPVDRPRFSDIVEMFNTYIIPQTCTPTTGKARYKVHIKGGTSEDSLLTSIVTELKYTPARSFDIEREESVLSESSRYPFPGTSDVPQETYMSMASSFYVKMNPILEGLTSPLNYDRGSYPYDTSDTTVRGIPQLGTSTRNGKRKHSTNASLYGSSYY